MFEFYKMLNIFGDDILHGYQNLPLRTLNENVSFDTRYFGFKGLVFVYLITDT